MVERHDDTIGRGGLAGRRPAASHSEATCERCGRAGEIHRGLCAKCRMSGAGDGKVRPDPDTVRKPPRPDVEPLHSPPWKRRGA
jgi:hypothetical protein